MRGFGGYTYIPEMHAYYVHNFGSNSITETASFTGGGPTFGTQAAPFDRNLFNIGVGVTVAKIGRVRLMGVYDYTGGATSHDSTIFLRLSTDF
jgi:outer membrane autotransporter protein